MKCPNCSNKLKYGKPTGLTTYLYICEGCSNEFELDTKGNLRMVSSGVDYLKKIFNMD